MNTIANVLSPPLLAALAGVTLGAGAVLFVMSRRGDRAAIDHGVPLSWAEPVEVRLILYLILAAICGTCALVLRLLFGFLTITSLAIGWLLVTAILLGFLGNLVFFYAATGSLLQAALGTMGRPPFWFFGLFAPLDGLIMDIGDAIAGFLFRPAPVRERPRKRRRYEYDDGLDYEIEAAVRRRRARRSTYADEDENDFVDEAAIRRRPEPETVERRRVARQSLRDDEVAEDREAYVPLGGDETTGTRRRAPVAPVSRAARRRPVYAEHDDEEVLGSPVSEESMELLDGVEDGEAPARSGRRVRGGPPRDIPRERLELAVQEYEAALTPSQMERLREMRSLVESIRQYA